MLMEAASDTEFTGHVMQLIASPAAYWLTGQSVQ
jgi:hypothetical protein